jgi:hypothetical protein
MTSEGCEGTIEKGHTVMPNVMKSAPNDVSTSPIRSLPAGWRLGQSLAWRSGHMRPAVKGAISKQHMGSVDGIFV